MSVHPTPPQWTVGNIKFYGGSPLCGQGTAQLFVQRSFGFDDACTAQVAYTVPFSPSSLLFAMIATASTTPQSTCALVAPPTEAALCTSVLNLLATTIPISVFASLELSQATAEASNLNLELIQLALNGSTQALLHQPMVTTTTDWAFLGWNEIYDWLDGTREVVSFDGDVQTTVLMSYRYDSLLAAVNPLEASWSMSRYFYFGACYVTAVLVGVSALVFATSLVFPPLGAHLFQFNFVGALSWIGRPLLLVRTATAFILLASASPKLVKIAGLTQLVPNARPWYVSALIASECTWLSYVLSDILLLFVPSTVSVVAAPLSSRILGVGIFLLDVVDPVTLIATVDRSCQGTSMDHILACQSGVVYTGSSTRTAVVAGIVMGMTVLIHVAVFVTRRPSKLHVGKNLLMTGAAAAFLSNESNRMPLPSCALFGVFALTIRGQCYIFDANRWVVATAETLGVRVQQEALELPSMTYEGIVLHEFEYFKLLLTCLGENSPVSRSNRCQPTTSTHLNSASHSPSPALVLERDVIRFRIGVVAGLAYMVASLVGSYGYFATTQVNMANDFWWANFNSTGGQTFVSNWFNKQLQLGLPLGSHLDDTSYADTILYNGTVSSGVQTSVAYARAIQFTDVSAAATAVAGLRNMNGYNSPWLATSYCWVDFNQTWSLAKTQARQTRCAASMASNAAVYLESVLRNVNGWQQSWGAAIDVTISQELRLSTAGVTWLESINSVTTSVAEEVEYWASHGATAFIVQWQNYKQHGVVETIAVQNAFGQSYALTLKRSQGSFSLGTQNSFVMNWPLASDLWAITTNVSGLAGKSLVRSSAVFAFDNVSIQSIVYANSSIGAQVDAAYTMSQALLGPFGSIDLIYVPCIAPVQSLYGAATRVLSSLLWSDATAQALYATLVIPASFIGVPLLWQNATLKFTGGNVLCSGMPPWLPKFGRYPPFGSTVVCSSAAADNVYLTPSKLFVSVLASGVVQANPTNKTARDLRWANICRTEMDGAPACVQALSAMADWVAQSVASSDLQNVLTLAQAATTAVRSLGIEVVQFALSTATPVFLRQPVVDTADTGDYAFWGLFYLQDWVLGGREAVAFQGDLGSSTQFTIYTAVLVQTPNPLEIPRNVALYFQGAVQFTTGMLFAVTIFALGYAIATHGFLEPKNMLKLNRMVGMVWIGRSLVVLRGATAICLLSTCTLDLVQQNSVSVYMAGTLPWYESFLAARELLWIVFVGSDIFSVVTQQYTALYASFSSIIAWSAAAILNFVNPQVHAVQVARVCHAIEFDLQSSCVAGTVAIGSVSRLLDHLWITGVSLVGSFAIVRLARPGLNTRSAKYHFLSCGAQFFFDLETWERDEQLYLDWMSAVLNGTLVFSMPHSSTQYVLDTKTWRLVVCHIATQDVPSEYRWALPLPKCNHRLNAVVSVREVRRPQSTEITDVALP
ncbi:Aste57867_2560 [Aphanomyces stellatus]|uniref:Aste57867_2560 protein n=1 Tax=Aphanomyces stellatus TaxID=120398 RepID=A0A485K9G4_9STRA|nr:hypothetical protein As57867_002553 [Aphanomyces stellatus]VFT79756.1 Aste57867_2560 [Aphanomyces stellatus]